MKKILKERGAGMIEYAIAAAALVTVFVVASMALQNATRERANDASTTLENYVPCDGKLSGDDCL